MSMVDTVIANMDEEGSLQNKSDDAHQRQVSAVKKFIFDVNSLKDEDNVLTCEDREEMSNLRSQTNAGLSRIMPAIC